ncbi:J protein JJJ2 [Malania oleifera]|uniref:J protein JJJ2 n=1 Tax=Malania oleifera TaxID=397392 RepID=UPI0025AE8E08|nr:J protein JJJ2 [Malania oleifera]XP_057977914.1 J protein JJJ2 [Malania oleifera]XP_057977915.1 J protein JJJ2 [Malania oleifera]XP_057977916.1 J protein JJJ2 [Malania oleifera]XP_057977917.1 J protein JJJ2 [Malania oleifera]XP_057977918.1 J protein JJJ2 [Malania oleifera]XP_057977919.1 J protein JJJ2 [Malania oleifera]XP_057977920.1 J protein JJJ2 [Malania oleifera]XP_057977921.1 J protein JJJ2 [Malania oleifera]
MDEEKARHEALRLRNLAEEKYRSNNLKSALKYAKRALRLSPDLDGVSEMVTTFKILRVAGKSSGETLDWYKVLQVEPFSHINSIKKQYKTLALTLHPDKNSFVASEEAFKLVGEAFRCLSDKIRRKEYDLKLRIAMQSAAAEVAGEAVETFWTACSTCRLLHQFERKYVGHNLMCPSCKKSFVAVEVSEGDESESGDKGDANLFRTRSGVSKDKKRVRNVGLKRKMGSVVEVLEKSRRGTVVGVVVEKELEKSSGRGISEKLRPVGGEMTLAEMQVEAKQKVQQKKIMKSKEKEKERESRRVKEREKLNESKNRVLKVERRSKLRGINIEIQRQRSSRRGNLKTDRLQGSKRGDREIMAVEDSDFYDFDKDRVERSFKRGQIWAIYDDDDGMPRHYGLIEEVVSVKPFDVKMSWLDLKNNGEQGLICWENLGFHISCGIFKVARKTSINYVNIFSHIVECERAAREVYKIYPKKGSVWALYNEMALDKVEGGNPSMGDRRCYDIVVFLTSYSEMYGLSMAYLEKADGFKTIFKRKEIGCHAIRWFEKDDVRLFSHQIPARKLSGEEVPNLSKDCWELDPASLPPELQTIGWGR